MNSDTIAMAFAVIYLVAVFAATLAFLRMRRENEELRDKLEAIAAERRREQGRHEHRSQMNASETEA